MHVQKIINHITSHLGHDQFTVSYAHDLAIQVCKQDLVRMIKLLKTDENLRFNQLIDICGVDYPDNVDRFTVVYHLLSLPFNQRIRIKITTAINESVESISDIFPAAGWYEREAYDMFGISFDNHPDLRRLLTDYEFEGFPLRKDFPLSGNYQLFYDPAQQKVVSQPVELSQAYREYEFSSPWQGVSRPYLPGDEKSLHPECEV